MKKILLVLLAIVVLTSVTANAAVVGQLGVLDTSGINPATGLAWAAGDQYRLVFVTSLKTNATSTDIATYNSFVQGIADAAGLGGVTWNMIGSTATVDARDNTGTNPDVDGLGVASFLLDGVTKVSDDNADMWDGDIDAFINLTETGSVYANQVHTGSDSDGTKSSIGRFLGNDVPDPSNGSPLVNVGHTDKTLAKWMLQYSVRTTGMKPVYALSEVLTVMDVNAARNVYPADGDDKISPANPLLLEWTMPDSNEVASVYADVFFGNDPCSLAPVPTVPADGKDVTSVGVDASGVGTYYWKVDVTVGDANTIEGNIWSFTTVADLVPTVSIETPAMMTWSDEPVQIQATVDDQGEGDVTYVWTAVPDDSTNADLTYDFDAGAEDPQVTITNTTGSMVTVTLTLTATDSSNAISKTVELDVYNDACDMTYIGYGRAVKKTDINADCATDLLDLARLASNWLEQYALTAPEPR